MKYTNIIKHMKRYSISLVIGKVQIKILITYYNAFENGLKWIQPKKNIYIYIHPDNCKLQALARMWRNWIPMHPRGSLRVVGKCHFGKLAVPTRAEHFHHLRLSNSILKKMPKEMHVFTKRHTQEFCSKVIILTKTWKWLKCSSIVDWRNKS